MEIKINPFLKKKKKKPEITIKKINGIKNAVKNGIKNI